MSYFTAVFGRLKWVVAVAAVGLVAASPALAAAKPTFGSRTLRKGMEGPDVRTLQRDLTTAGVWTFVSGVFSEGTQIHVKDFQSERGLPVDGIVGAQTADVLKSVVNGIKAKDKKTKPKSRSLPTDDSGGASAVPPPTDATPEPAHLNSQGLAVAPADAPQVIQEVIAAANKIAFKPYVYGGGHASFQSDGYDCSGSVSYALHGGGLLASPLDSTQFESYGDAGAGRWISIWTNAGHAYMDIAGLWFDTAAQSSTNGNDRWSATRISSPDGFMERHPAGW